MRRFVISAKDFWGYTAMLSPSFATPAAQIAEIKKRLRTDLMKLNLVVLAERLDTVALHVHDEQPNDETTYVCDHTH